VGNMAWQRSNIAVFIEIDQAYGAHLGVRENSFIPGGLEQTLDQLLGSAFLRGLLPVYLIEAINEIREAY
jgi:hypothetical protein